MYESNAQTDFNDTALRFSDVNMSTASLVNPQSYISPIAAEYIPNYYVEPKEAMEDHNVAGKLV